MIPSKLPVFRHALAGLAYLVKSQPHARWHLLAMATVIAFAAWFQVSRLEWIALVFAMGLVWTAEAFNTAVELACDAITTEPSRLIGLAKDVAAGAVLLASMAAVVVGGLVFVPRFF